jgi:hypothetical protein
MTGIASKLKDVLERVKTWPESDQEELAEYAEVIERRHSGDYEATAEELGGIDDGDRTGVASEKEVAAAFRTFRRA